MSNVFSPLPHESSTKRSLTRLFVISFLILFFELACIRWFASTVIFLTFFTNFVLMACFLGMSVGCLAARRRQNLIKLVIPMMVLAAAAAVALLWAYNSFDRMTIDMGGQESPQQIFFGTDARPKDPAHFVIPVEAIAGFFFLLIATIFLGLGQEMGRAFDALPGRIAAYTVNIAGSLLGILAFAAASYFRAPAWGWFALSMMIVVALLRRWSLAQSLGGLAVVLVVALADYPRDSMGQVVEVTWSPYYKVQYKPVHRSIDVNNLGHQGMLPLEQTGAAYSLPHLLNRDAGGEPFADVMIIGAGSGNDVQAALTHGARHIDAVEIDPVINELGKLHHPDRPFDDPRVTVHLDDGRSFLQKSTETYDLVSYALVDSLALHSSYSNLRLESFLFTEQALRDVKARLKPGGVFAMYNFYRQGWVVGRLAALAEKVFGAKPLVISMPYQPSIDASNNQKNYITFVLAGASDSSRLDAIRTRLPQGEFFWLNRVPNQQGTANGYGPRGKSPLEMVRAGWSRIGAAKVNFEGIGRLPSDDWPFLYLREPVIPGLNVRGMLIVAVLSLAFLFGFAPIRRVRPDGRMFFLGAGFMLLETKSVVHMALLFGSTWAVNSIVVFAILVMVLLSNLYVALFRPGSRSLRLYYGLLIAALLVNTLVPMTVFLAVPGVARVIVSCAVVSAPIFFAGIIFASHFRDSDSPDVAFGSNIGGAILGGLCENASVIVGFNNLLILAIAFYGLSAVFGRRARS